MTTNAYISSESLLQQHLFLLHFLSTILIISKTPKTIAKVINAGRANNNIRFMIGMLPIINPKVKANNMLKINIITSTQHLLLLLELQS